MKTPQTVLNNNIPNVENLRFGIVVSQWNTEVTEAMFKSAYETLLKGGCLESDIVRTDVPGSFELPIAAKWLLDSMSPDAIICLGCVIQGETRHFDFICQAVSIGIMQLGLDYTIPVIFGVLTTENMEQAVARAGGNHSNKGIEAAITAMEMATLRSKI